MIQRGAVQISIMQNVCQLAKGTMTKEQTLQEECFPS